MIDRIKQIMEYLQMSPTAFADTIGIGRSNLTHIFSGRNQPSLDLAKKILNAFPSISTEWLIMGMGNMLQEPVAAATLTEPINEGQTTEALNKNQPDLFDDVADEASETVSSMPSTTNITPPVALPEKEDPEIPETRTQSVMKRKNPVKTQESNISAPASKRVRFLNSQEDKKISKIIFFYEDQSFEIYTPS